MFIKKSVKINFDEKRREKSEIFIEKINSDMYYQSELNSDSITFDWLDIIENACPYIDNIIRKPKLALINEEEVVKVEKAKKISVESVKDLSKHTHYIDEVNEVTQEVKPSKILISRREETYNTYENRFAYTLIQNLSRFLYKKETMLENLEAKNDKVLEYAANTSTGSENIKIELKIVSNKVSGDDDKNDFENEIESIKFRVKRIRDYIISWKRNEFMTSLDKAHIAPIVPPIKKTNMILKNPNFQIAMKLWVFLQNYDENLDENETNKLNTEGDNLLKGVLDDTFLTDYFVLDSISSSKKEQKNNLSKYALIMVSQQIRRTVSLLLNSGIDISEEEIISLISNEIKNEKNKRVTGAEDVKKKFQSVMEEYLEKTQNYL